MKLKFFTIFLLLFLITPFFHVGATDNAVGQKLKGRILLQVESHGEAWYVEPKSGERYYMANGDEAYRIMRELGIGITNTDLEKAKLNINFAKKHSGKIFLQVESHGEAYYVDSSGNLHYLKNGAEAYNVMRELGLGIKNSDLNKIRVHGSNVEQQDDSAIIQNDLILDSDGDGVPDKYDFHPNEKSIVSNKIYKFKSSGLPFVGSNFTQKEFEIRVQIPRDRYLMYAEYLPHKFNDDFSNIRDFISADDSVIFVIAYQLKSIAEKENMSYEQLALDFVQQMQYNDDKYTSKDEYPKYPIEILMDGTGDCEDLSFLLSSLWLSFTNKDTDILNYALIVYDNHVAVGYSLKFLDQMSDTELSTYLNKGGIYDRYSYTINNHRYFYTETTNDLYEIGEMPDDIYRKKAQLYELSKLKNMFDK